MWRATDSMITSALVKLWISMYRQFTAARRSMCFGLRTSRRRTPYSLLKACHYFDAVFQWCVGLQIMEMFLPPSTNLRLQAARPRQLRWAGFQAHGQVQVGPGGEKSLLASMHGLIFNFHSRRAQLYSFNLTIKLKLNLIWQTKFFSFAIKTGSFVEGGLYFLHIQRTFSSPQCFSLSAAQCFTWCCVPTLPSSALGRRALSAPAMCWKP